MAPALSAPLTRSGGFAGGAAGAVIVAVVSLAGIYLAWLGFARRPVAVRRLASRPGFQRLVGYALAGWGVDRLYDIVFVRPFLWLARRGQGDVIDFVVSGITWPAAALSRLLHRTQDGRVRYYLGATALGVVVFVAVGLLR